MKAKPDYEGELAAIFDAEIEDKYVRQHPVLNPKTKRHWHLDFAFLEYRLCVEVDGGTWGKSIHGYGKPYQAQCYRTLMLTIQGWVICRVTPELIRGGQALEWVKFALSHRREGMK